MDRSELVVGRTYETKHGTFTVMEIRSDFMLDAKRADGHVIRFAQSDFVSWIK